MAQSATAVAILESTNVVEILRPGALAEAEKVGALAVEQSTDPAELRRIAVAMGRLKKIVGEVTGKRVDINRMARPMVKAVVKAGRILADRDKHEGGRPTKTPTSAVGVKLALSEMGFTHNRASRWQTIGLVPDEEIKVLEDKVCDSDDGIWGISFLLKRGLEIKREDDLSEQRRLIAAGEFTLGVGPYDVIAYDPPWPYGTTYDPNARRSGSPYPEMTLEQIAMDGDAEIVAKAADDCILWLWTTHKFMRHSFPLLDRWGFEDKAILTWEKDKIGIGAWLRSNSEFCILAVRGKPKVDLTSQATVLHGPLREHSRKPNEFFQMVEQLCIGVRRCDRFSREQRKGWDVGGNTPELFDQRVAE